MAIQIQSTTGDVLGVDTAFKAARVSLRPPEVLSWNSIGAQTGAMTALAAAAPIFAFRNIAANPVMVRRVGIGWFSTVAFTAAQMTEFGLMVARNWTTSDTGGTAIALTGNNAKHRTSLVTPSSLDCRISTTAALTAGARTLDTNTLAQQAGWSIGSPMVVPASLNNLLAQDAGDYPLVLAQNEGFIIQNLLAMGAAGVVKAYVNVEFGEAASY
jgi:hypothetical protein